jgi:O-antigen ligase
MWLSPLYLTFLLELCLLGLASFLGAFCFGLFRDFIPKGENVRPKQASGLSKLVV